MADDVDYGAMLFGEGLKDAMPLMECDPPYGWSFYAKSPPLEAEEWRDGSFVDGDAVRLVDNGDGTMAVEFRESGGQFRPVDGASYQVPGAQVPSFFVDNGGATFEVYTFQPGLGKLFWSRHRTGSLLTGVAAFEADCH
jgi:hypothetical protein